LLKQNYCIFGWSGQQINCALNKFSTDKAYLTQNTWLATRVARTVILGPIECKPCIIFKTFKNLARILLKRNLSVDQINQICNNSVSTNCHNYTAFISDIRLHVLNAVNCGHNSLMCDFKSMILLLSFDWIRWISLKTRNEIIALHDMSDVARVF